MLSTVLIVVLILILIGALPTWNYSRNWGYAPTGLLGTVLIVLLILVLLGRVWRSSAAGADGVRRRPCRKRPIEGGAMDLAPWLGGAATLASTISFAPQAWKVIRTRRTEGISVKTYSVTVAAFACWLAYGFALGEWPIIVSNIVCLVFSIFILTMTILPRRSREAVADAIVPADADADQPADADAQNKA